MAARGLSASPKKLVTGTRADDLEKQRQALVEQRSQLEAGVARQAAVAQAAIAQSRERVSQRVRDLDKQSHANKVLFRQLDAEIRSVGVFAQKNHPNKGDAEVRLRAEQRATVGVIEQEKRRIASEAEQKRKAEKDRRFAEQKGTIGVPQLDVLSGVKVDGVELRADSSVVREREAKRQESRARACVCALHLRADAPALSCAASHAPPRARSVAGVRPLLAALVLPRVPRRLRAQRRRRPALRRRGGRWGRGAVAAPVARRRAGGGQGEPWSHSGRRGGRGRAGAAGPRGHPRPPPPACPTYSPRLQASGFTLRASDVASLRGRVTLLYSAGE